MPKSIESVRERLKKLASELPEAEAEASGRLSEPNRLPASLTRSLQPHAT
jgi:hypothetical protein